MVFDRGAGTITITDSNGNVVGTYPAANNTTSTSGGSWPNGTYDYSHYMSHPESDQDRGGLIAWAFIDWKLLFFVGLVARFMKQVPGFVWFIILAIVFSIALTRIGRFRRLVSSIANA